MLYGSQIHYCPFGKYLLTVKRDSQLILYKNEGVESFLYFNGYSDEQYLILVFNSLLCNNRFAFGIISCTIIKEVEAYSRDVTTWLNFVECVEIKAFVQQTIAPSVRIGAQNLLMVRTLFAF